MEESDGANPVLYGYSTRDFSFLASIILYSLQLSEGFQRWKVNGMVWQFGVCNTIILSNATALFPWTSVRVCFQPAIRCVERMILCGGQQWRSPILLGKRIQYLTIDSLCIFATFSTQRPSPDLDKGIMICEYATTTGTTRRSPVTIKEIRKASGNLQVSFY